MSVLTRAHTIWLSDPGHFFSLIFSGKCFPKSNSYQSTRPCCKHFIEMTSFTPHHSPLKLRLFPSLLSRWENCVSERLSNLPKLISEIAQLISEESNQTIWFQSLCSQKLWFINIHSFPHSLLHSSVPYWIQNEMCSPEVVYPLWKGRKHKNISLPISISLIFLFLYF